MVAQYVRVTSCAGLVLQMSVYVIVEVIVCTAVAGTPPPNPTLALVDTVEEDLGAFVVFAPSAGAGGGVAESRALTLAYTVSSTLGARSALFEEGRFPPQYSVLFPGQGTLQLARFWIALVPASRVSAQ